MPKRRRTEDGMSDEEPQDLTLEDNPEGPTVRSGEVWFDDGNIILRAGNTEFKVHRGVLASHSPVFADMFQVPQPTRGPTVDDCPEVRLHDDTFDVTYMLAALYGKTDLLGSDGVLRFRAMRAMIRLGKKYQIEHLRNDGLRCLKREFTMTLEDFDKLDPDEYLNFSPLPKDSNPKAIDPVGTMVATINLALECGIQSVLPAVYLLTTSNTLGEFLYHKDASSIPFDAMRSCIYGREQLLQEWLGSGNAHISASTSISHTGDCKAASISLVRAASKCPDDLSNLLLPWVSLVERWDTLKQPSERLCRTCKQNVQLSHDTWRRKVWEDLPKYFKLGVWGDLQDAEM
ncbi:hypothetical protein FA13DRAFT_1691369 [Coprinellus micaceus]|uniref:BTB domain-containing protein n=1 Tax=Coprinellus micaceus TaxID=71717 RepID=A0A4Y7T068_COPMI|nr:hypothetical protein FA13DRAFT_1691369 [Coprinellus micaceus]